jgi:peptide/nickel transport system permease protein
LAVQRYQVILQSLLHLLPVLLGISIVSFLLVQLIPGDPIRLLVGPRASEDVIAAIRARYGLDQPLFQQYLTYLGNVFQGDFGQSIMYHKPVIELIMERLPRTLFLAAYVVCMTIPSTIFLAITAARNQGQRIDLIITTSAVFGITIPVFWLGIMMARLFGVELNWFPVSGYGNDFLGHLHHLFLPALSTAIWMVPVLVRNLRAAILEQMEADYVVAGRSKGLPEQYLFYSHILKNSIMPTLNLFGVMVAYLIGGTVIVESVYAVPGLGKLMIASIFGRDYYVVQAITLFYAVVTIAVTLVVDIISTIIDPRVKL